MWLLTVIDDGEEPKFLEINTEEQAINIQFALVNNGCMVKRKRFADVRTVVVVAPTEKVSKLVTQRNKLRNLVEDSQLQLNALEKRLKDDEDTGLA